MAFEVLEVKSSFLADLEGSYVTPLDVQALFLERLGISLGEEMTDYLLRRFREGGAAAVPAVHASDAGAELLPAPVRRFVELTEALGDGAAIPADATDPILH
jgi:hypothetical protein